MERRKFVKDIAAASAIGGVAQNIGASALISPVNKPVAVASPRAT